MAQADPQWPQAILHVDGDAFFASCEQALHPELRGRPVVTGQERGIVSAASYEAKARGVSRGTPLWEVKKIIPDAVIVSSDYRAYDNFSRRMFAVMRHYTPLVEEYSIDEGFADVTGMWRPFDAPYEELARRMKREIQAELGITVSVGLSVSKVLAKVGSKFRKPDGLTVIAPGRADEFLSAIDVGAIWGIGPRLAARCRALGIRTALDLAQQKRWRVEEYFAKPTVELWEEMNGASVWPVIAAEKASYASIGKTRTFAPPTGNREFLLAQLLKNLENACSKARRYHLEAKTMAVVLRQQKDFSWRSAEISLERATAYPTEMTTALESAFTEVYRPRTPYRATGVTLLGLVPADATQVTLFEAPDRLEKMRRLYAAVDKIAEKFGKHTVHSAGAASAHAAQDESHYDDNEDRHGISGGRRA